MRRTLSIATAILLSATISADDSPSSKASKDGSKNDAKGETIALFDGKTLQGWTTLDGKSVTKGWEVADGTIHRAARGGDIITKQQFGDFDLRFEWKVAKKANSGLKYKFKRFGRSWLGCEYQVIDDGPKGSTSKNGAASLYDVVPPNEKKKLNPVGEWNSSRVVCRGSTLEHWLNGEKVIEIDTSSERWDELIGKSKFRKVAGFGKNERGHIMLQEHGGEVWFRNLTLTKLSK